MQSHLISVTLFSNTTVRGGAEEHMLTLLRGLDRRYFRLQLVCSPEVAKLMKQDIPQDVVVYPLVFQNPWHVSGALRLVRFLRRQRTDVLHSHMFRSSFAASPVGKLCGVHLVVETPHVRERWRQGVLKSHFFVDRAVGRFVDYYIAVSEANAHYLNESKGLPARKIRVIRNGCDLASFAPPPGARRDMRLKLGLADSDPVLIVVGRLEPQKGHRILLDAFVAVRREFPAAKLVCVGTGSLEQELNEQTRSLGLSANVQFVGYQSNVPHWLAMADVSVLPSFYEGLPLVAIETSAAGCPMVATEVDGTAEVVINGKTGLTVPPGDSVRLAQAICRVLGDEKMRREFAQNAHAWVSEHFDKSKQLQQTQDLYLQAFSNRAELQRTKNSTIEDQKAECLTPSAVKEGIEEVSAK
jgi:glycosyltransferase involved in cell wall biosynthesis